MCSHPESCQIDRVSVMNEDGECPEHQCAEGYGGELCNSKLHCQCFHATLYILFFDIQHIILVRTWVAHKYILTNIML